MHDLVLKQSISRVAQSGIIGAQVCAHNTDKREISPAFYRDQNFENWSTFDRDRQLQLFQKFCHIKKWTFAKSGFLEKVGSHLQHLQHKRAPKFAVSKLAVIFYAPKPRGF